MVHAQDEDTLPTKDSGVEQPSGSLQSVSKEKKSPYVNPERVNTGGLKRDKISEDELAERMARMREQNERIKQRRADVQADEEAFRKTETTDKLRLVESRKVQDSIDHAREQNAKRKMEKIQSREWDSEKGKAGRWSQNVPTTRGTSARAHGSGKDGNGKATQAEDSGQSSFIKSPATNVNGG
ncbi:hypothetical protein BDN72DRAFT_770094 [Pluteus cervinus]|uniref:Uncharacterized protein n=1 Tax=Pluteus cervinus TaxID=181527 RepID=A0ACD3AQG6_9AGAR|nr:hypothetical protein BDN72DRAFT_770094 [Pluteus cervinus]